ncbi:MAG TPA: N-acetylmuramoyl-L-alanine amidase, partial [Acidothermaceae bacterium]
MRRLVTVSMLALVVPAIVVAVPVVSAPQPSPRPVAATMHHIAISPMLALVSATHSQPLTLVAQQSTSNFRAVGLSWRTPPSGTAITLRAQIEVRSGGQWSGWQELDSSDPGTDASSDGADAPAAGAARDGTDPLWVDHGNGVAIRLLSVSGGEPIDLRVDLIDPGTSPADATAGTAPAASSAQADAGQPTILTRTDWGADESLRMNACPTGPQYTGTPQVAFLHHTDTPNNYAPEDVPAIIRSIYAFHVEGEGWCDVGYNFLVDRFGRIWEGRYGGIDKAVLGAHTGGFNTNSFGVSLIGTFNTAQPPQPMIDATAQLMAWKLALSYANPVGTATLTAAPFSEVRFAAGTKVLFNVISGHRDADQTSCPGNAAYALLPQLRQETLQDMGAGLVNPTSIVTTPRTVAGNGTVHVVAGMLAPGSWQLLVQDASGSTVRTMTGSGAGIDTTWDMTSDAGTPVPAGAYTLTLSGSQNNQTALPWTTSLVVGGVFGSLDTATTQIGQISLSGWAARAADTTPAVLNITIDGALAGSITPSRPRLDVAAIYPQYTGNLGYSASEPATPGYHNLCVIGVD